MTELIIQQQLFKHFRARKGYRYQLCNSYIFRRWESDFFCLAASGYAYEVEIKCSRGDYAADFKKYRKHKILQQNDCDRRRPNKFIYAVPEGLVQKDEVPDYAGLIWILPDRRRRPVFIKRPPAIHSKKFDYTKVLLDKYYWAYLNHWNQLEAGKTFEFPDTKMRRTK